VKTDYLAKTRDWGEDQQEFGPKTSSRVAYQLITHIAPIISLFTMQICLGKLALLASGNKTNNFPDKIAGNSP
jgi:hypothetical protein